MEPAPRSPLPTPPFGDAGSREEAPHGIRAAAPDDLADAARVYQDAARDLHERRQAERNPWLDAKARDFDLRAATTILTRIAGEYPGAVQVAERHGEIVGVGAVVLRERHAHILFLFVAPEWQRKGIGRDLLFRLRTVIADAGAEVVTLTASEDRRAWSRYLAMGLYPGPPLVSMRALTPVLPDLPWQDGLEPIPIALDRPDVLGTVGDLDRLVKGVRRMEDIHRWLAEEGAQGDLLVRRGDGRPAGYYLVSRDERFGRIGPVTAVDREGMGDVLKRALHAAGRLDPDRTLVWRADVPGQNHEAIAPLTAAGFHPWNLLPWFANGEIGLWDRYIVRDEDQL
ncbi:MAG TPA: GNAT family N-acetyltransferase [Thermomicrobiales bacterium]|nr:GNAT family N-acetyltransferase [Thermomicrobiales bacterium]